MRGVPGGRLAVAGSSGGLGRRFAEGASSPAEAASSPASVCCALCMAAVTPLRSLHPGLPSARGLRCP